MPVGLAAYVRRGEGPFWGSLKQAAHALLHFHLPVGSLGKPLFGVLYCAHVGIREGLAWARRLLWDEPLFRSQCASVGLSFRMEQLPYLSGRGRIVIGNAVRLSGKSSLIFGNRLHAEPEISVGDGTFIGHGCSFAVARCIRIGRNCLLAGGVSVRDFDGHPLDAGRRRAGEPTPPQAIRPVVIGDDVWVGGGAIILKGVTVGDRSVVGAGAVVTRDVAPDTVVAGNPARLVKDLAAAPLVLEQDPNGDRQK